jgi:TRAP-type C4-dicarboxylate transport system permease small subunit
VVLVFRLIQRLEEVCLAGGMLLIASLTVINVVLRTATGDSLVYAEEVSQFGMIAVTFIGASYAASKGRHIRMTAIYDNLSPARQKAFMLVITASTAVLLAVLTWYSIRYALTVRALGSVSPALQVPLWMIYLMAPIGLGLGSIQFTLAFFRNIVSGGVWLSFDHRDEYEDADSHGGAL